MEEIKNLAKRKGCTLSQIALAWVAAQGMISIPGTTKAHRLEENWKSRNVELTDEEKKEMRKIIDSSQIHGVRFSPQYEATIDH